jgi:hypothetical protein
MAMVRKRGEKYELRIKHRLLPKGIFYSTFANEVDARNYGAQLEALLVSTRSTWMASSFAIWSATTCTAKSGAARAFSIPPLVTTP